MTSKIIVNTIEADTGISSVTFASNINLQNDSSILVSSSGIRLGTGSTIAAPSANEITLSTNSAERLRVDSAGRMLLGTTTAGNGNADNLTIADSGNCGITIRSGTTNFGEIYFSDATSGGGEYDGWIAYSHSSRYMVLATAQTERLRITNTGRMGVGTNDPAALLEVRDSENTTKGVAQIRISKGVGNGAAPTSVSRADSYLHIGGSEYHTSFGRYNIAFGYTNDEVGSGIPAYIGYIETSLAGYTQGDLVFGTRDNVSGSNNPTERLRIRSDGSIATGGLLPTDGSFCVNSTIRSQNSSSNISYIGFTQYTSNTSVGGMFSYMGGDGRSTGYLTFNTNDTERLRIDSSGRALIGSPNGSTSQFLQIKGDTGAANNGGTILLQNGVADSSAGNGTGLGGIAFGGATGNQYCRIEGFADGSGGTNDYPGRIVFSTTADAASSPTERMRIDSNGVITMPNQPAFHARGGTALANNTNTIIIGGATEFNIGGHYNTSNGRFTAPVDGVYQFSFWGLIYPHNSGVINIFYSKNGTQYAHLVQGGADSNTHTSRSGIVHMGMSAGDYAELRINRGSSTGVNAYGSQWNMSGHLIG
tara:strand:+ start:296 stop:2068 length:1773 start_codon:yes stop_codon:yes gene_type:complete